MFGLSDTVLLIQPQKPIKFGLIYICIFLQLEVLIDISHGSKYFGWEALGIGQEARVNNHKKYYLAENVF